MLLRIGKPFGGCIDGAANRRLIRKSLSYKRLAVSLVAAEGSTNNTMPNRKACNAEYKSLGY